MPTLRKDQPSGGHSGVHIVIDAITLSENKLRSVKNYKLITEC